jgi:methionyl-tRNA formyltransferase
MRVVFLGTPEFAVPSLRELVAAEHSAVAVFTQPDRPKGRGNQMTPSPVKVAALESGLPVYQPERIRRPENLELLRSFEADLMVVVGYGQIIPQSIIDLPKHGILNVHASLLPKYRGAAPIQWAIANGEIQTGVTVMQIDAGLDTGDMLAQEVTSIAWDETAPELADRLSVMGAELLISVIEQIEKGIAAREKQDDAEATLAPILKREDGAIDWSQSAKKIFDRLRGFTPWPGAYTSFRGLALGIAKARPSESSGNPVPGAVRVHGKILAVECGGNSMLELLEVQPAGKKRMSGEAFRNGYRVTDGELMGEAK